MATIVDLSQLAAPDVVEVLDYETILSERKATLVSLYPADQQEAVARTLTLESEPVVKLLQENAYREVIWRQRVNEAARAVMLAYAAGADLDQLGANSSVERLVITPADETTMPPTPAVMESDTDYRLRIQQAPEGLSTAGSTGAYQFHGRSADGRVADISVISPEPACVTVSVLSRENNGAASDELLAVVRAALNDEDVRPVADRVTVQSATIVDYIIDAALYLYPGPESEPVLSAAKAKLQTYISAQHRLGRDIRKSAIYAALHVEGVQRVELTAPVADIVLDDTQASFCTAYSVTVGGNDE
jgi:phage-related baseplate assembly protein